MAVPIIASPLGRRGKVLLFLLFPAVELNDLRAKYGKKDIPAPRINPPKLLHHHGVFKNPQTGAPVFLFNEEAYKTQLTSLFPKFPRKFFFTIIFPGYFWKFSFGKFPGRSLDIPLFMLKVQNPLFPPSVQFIKPLSTIFLNVFT